MFRDYTPDELAVIKAKYATEGDVLEAPLLIEQKARDMLRHYVERGAAGGLQGPGGRHQSAGAVTYREKLEQARRELVAELEALPARDCSHFRKMRSRSSMRTRASWCAPTANWPSSARWRSPSYFRRSQRPGIVVGLDRQGQAGRTHQALQAEILRGEDRQDRSAVHPGREQHADDGLRCAGGAGAVPRPEDRRTRSAAGHRPGEPHLRPEEVRLRGGLHRRGAAPQRGAEGLRRRGHRGHADRHQRRTAEAARPAGAGRGRLHGPRHHRSARAGGCVRAVARRPEDSSRLHQQAADVLRDAEHSGAPARSAR